MSHTSMLLLLLISLFLSVCSRQQVTANMNGIPHTRPPGTLLLNMLIKNEEEHLNRTLPRWAKIIDYWIIGVDDKNTDSSPEVIRKHLSHIPGEIVIVAFDGMGPTWKQLVQVGIEKYPDATHGIISDADFAPVGDAFDKMELDVRCSKHMYTIWTESHNSERRMDWVYRNIPGATVKRRTHQTVEVPRLLDQEVFQTLLPLTISERAGGYQDRTGKKNEAYIKFLMDDLVDYPGDARTLYYLGYAHFDMFNAVSEKYRTDQAWKNLGTAVDYFRQRASIPDANEEELWFTILKLGEIYERFYNDWVEGERFYKLCIEKDKDRADPWFYIGQHYSNRQQYQLAIPYLQRAATTPFPDRALFQWHYLYDCLATFEYAKALFKSTEQHSIKMLQEIQLLINTAKCGENHEIEDLRKMAQHFSQKMTVVDRNGLLTVLLKFLNGHTHLFFDVLSVEDDESDSDGVTYYSQVVEHVAVLAEHRKQVKSNPTEQESCRKFRQSTTPYLRFYDRSKELITKLVANSKITQQWDQLNNQVRSICR